ncbi:hypothetical protein SMACR_04247 [Sordaria macrospora]|uniref:WGS project CABT00000000 data, contig 2.19 n=2 Tax=Sordaria macrospora TaxID=5147 RepID=F7W1A5_SORMK|nr:uncharacterized protein SMAC_04247 [Sordaria macrospora k-hell]KAA8631878.1 hypothetical protein SMACR_04247 [Sordaria macrospora]KAH7626416.1 hypothetical protein B0T09DRAFT_348873 [Sordaria sp. MPI-SDFR-AT-0083]WPJ58033.1 hypothetical protein SMAC4_04247 [Sordaria macrospora]CCC04880.1 unnamed protein product [Sordaria macrospora k-hell]
MISNNSIIRFALLCASSSLLYTTPGRASPTSSSSTSPAAFVFPSCVESCVNVSGCGTDNPQCMCKFSGRGIFLELALTCMSYYCEAELRRADDTLINIMEAGCRSIRQPIPEEKIEIAEAWASRLVKNLPPPSPTIIVTTTVHHQPLPTTLVTVQPPPVTATTADVPPPPASTTKSTSIQTTLESSSSAPSTTASPSDAFTSAPESSSTSISSVTTLQPQSSSTKPADEAATSAPASNKPRPDSSPYGPGPILSSGGKSVMVSLPFLHWVSAFVCLAVAGVVFA